MVIVRYLGWIKIIAWTQKVKERKKGVQNGSRFLSQVTSFMKTSKTAGAAVGDRNEEFKFKYIELELIMKQLHDGYVSKEEE